MAVQLQAPPIPADADLTHYDDMPLEVRRLRDSGIAGEANAEVFRCAVLLWCVAWHQVPAGSLPKDDEALCRLVGLGRDLRTWKKIKGGVLRGWQEFADGRLYHRVVAEKVMDGWNSTRLNRWAKECDRIRKENKAREKRGEPELTIPEKPGELPLEWPQISAGKVVGFPPEKRRVPPEKGLNRIEGNGRDNIDSAAAASCPATAPARADGIPPERPPPATPDDDPGPIPDFLRSAKASRTETDEAFALWSSVAFDLRIPDPGFLNSERRATLSARLAECGGMEGWTLAMENLRAAEFLRDDDDPSKPKHWVNLASLLKPENFTGLMEGRYAERRTPQSRPADGGAPTVADGVAAAFARRYAQPG